ncbi:MAG: YcgL domain-containing protein [Acidiferrobacterales bacterium]
MKCAIYKSYRRVDTYLYVEEENDFTRVPKTLLALLGKLGFVMTLELTPERTLAQADPKEVRRQLKEQGYYLQLPPGDFPTTPS